MLVLGSICVFSLGEHIHHGPTSQEYIIFMVHVVFLMPSTKPRIYGIKGDVAKTVASFATNFK